MQKISLELKVGIFVVLGLTILGMLVFKAGDFYIKPGYTIRFVFKNITGIDQASSVKLAGVKVGEVKSVHVVRSVQGETQVEIEAWIAQGIFIEEDAKVRVNSLGLLGEKYIEILPGTSGSKTVSDSGTILGKTPFAVDDIVESTTRLMRKVEGTVDSLNNIVSDPEFKPAVKSTFVNGDRLAKNLLEMTDDLKDTAKSARIVLGRLRDGEGTLGRLLKDDKMAKDMETFVEDIKAHPWKLLKR
ncbi:MAG: MlaD family protein [Candidatus Omnitrophota bacterium]